MPRTKPAAAVRREPLQERSAGTVAHILKAASRLLAKRPFETVTTSLIAREARVSVGGLYRFFPDKQSIMDAIAARHMRELRTTLEKRFAADLPPGGPALLDSVVDAFVTFIETRPDFRKLAFGKHIGALTREDHVEHGAGPAALVKLYMVWNLGMEDTLELDLRMRVAIEIGERLIAYAFEQNGPAERNLVICEMKRIVSAYLFNGGAEPSPHHARARRR